VASFFRSILNQAQGKETSMKYYLDYQQIDKGALRPKDEGTTIEIDIQQDGHAILPNVGDYVSIDNSGTDMANVSGKVRSRLFRYTGQPQTCHINIVVEETDDNWGKLVKE
jgi:hypothetical protein